MKVLVTGVTGFLGRIVARQLLRDGDAVRALVRPGRGMSLPGVERVEGDLSRREDIEAAVQGIDAVVHCGARVQTKGRWEEFAAVNVDAVKHIIDLATRAGVRRIVHVSSLSVYAVERDGVVITEDSPYDEGAGDRGFYSRSKLAADRAAMQAAADGAPVTVIRPGVLYGPGRKPPLGRQSFAVGPLRLILGRPQYLLPLSFGDNVADAILLALRCDRAAGRAYTIVDPQVSMRDYLSLYRSIGTVSWRPVFVPASTVMLMVRPVGLAFRAVGRKTPVSAHQIQRSTWSATFDCARARTELGWQPRTPLGDALRQSLGTDVSPHAGTIPAAKYEAN